MQVHVCGKRYLCILGPTLETLPVAGWGTTLQAQVQSRCRVRSYIVYLLKVLYVMQ